MNANGMLRIVRTGCALLLVAALSGCASDLFCLKCGSQRAASTPLVEYLYPTGEVPSHDATPQLAIPLTVGLSFLPTHGFETVGAAAREEVLATIRARFRNLPYVRDIVIVPDHYLRRGGGFEALQQIARLQGLDVIALVSYDQVSHAGENKRSFAYLTIVGAYFVKGSTNETHTLLDLAVLDPKSRSLILRAGGTSSLQGTTTAVEMSEDRRGQQLGGMQLATEQLGANLERELTLFSQRVRAGTAPVQVVRRSTSGPGGGGGSLGGVLLAMLAAMLAVSSRRAHASRERRSPASVPG